MAGGGFSQSMNHSMEENKKLSKRRSFKPKSSVFSGKKTKLALTPRNEEKLKYIINELNKERQRNTFMENLLLAVFILVMLLICIVSII